MGWRLGRVVTTVLAAVLLMAGCTASQSAPASTPTRTPTASPTTPVPVGLEVPRLGSYVALGDSYVSGPGVARIRPNSGFCLRSSRNWPSLLARAGHAKHFADVSCAGATTGNVLMPGRVAPAQTDALAADTDLVTVGIGGNDGGLFASLISACTGDATTCATFARDTAPSILDSTVSSIDAALAAVRTRSPKARILLVGYLRIMPTTGTCSAIGIPKRDAPAVVSAEEDLDEALREAAVRADVTYVSMRSRSTGHDACAGDQAWTNGANVTDDDGIVFHPRQAGMQAVATAVAKKLA